MAIMAAKRGDEVNKPAHPDNPKPRLGAHLSIGKGLISTAEQAVKWGVETFQIFLRNPRGSAARVWSEKEIRSFTSRIAENGIDPVVAHIPYIVNPASSRDDLYELALRVVAEDLIRCDLIGARYLVLHPGSRGEAPIGAAIERLVGLLNLALEDYEGKATILIETMAGMGTEIGASIDELHQIIQGVKRTDRIGACIDTCHLMGAGYDLASPAGLNHWKKEFGELIGLEKIKVVHINDSQREVGSRIDRHCSIGTGHIGIKGFARLMADPTLRELPFILETPAETMPNDLKTLHSLRKQG